MNKQIPSLQTGDKICIVAPAKAIDSATVMWAKKYWEDQGFKVELGKHVTGTHNYFSGTDEERLFDLQQAMNDPSAKAIICARGGYGCVRILDRINWSAFIREPKWLIGFSDITVLHQRIQRYGIESLHATMPLNYESNSQEALASHFEALTGALLQMEVKTGIASIPGEAKGVLTGGNLSILYSLLGTDDQVDYEGKVLFIEDLSEQLYHLDRMLYSFNKAGVFGKIRGLIVGGFTDLKDTEMPFGQNLKEMVLAHFTYKRIPIVFDFPAGHISDNRTLILGREIELVVQDEITRINYQ